MWSSIKHAMNNKSGCSGTKVEKVVDGKTVEYTEEPDVVQCIQEETEVQFQLANSAPICKGLLGKQLGYLADTATADAILNHTFQAPPTLTMPRPCCLIRLVEWGVHSPTAASSLR
jgi:endonuclease YncB( thermonuclease family)